MSYFHKLRMTCLYLHIVWVHIYGCCTATVSRNGQNSGELLLKVYWQQESGRKNWNGFDKTNKNEDKTRLKNRSLCLVALGNKFWNPYFKS